MLWRTEKGCEVNPQMPEVPVSGEGDMRRFRRWILKRRIRQAKKLMRLIDSGIKKVGMPRYERRRLWRDFAVSKEDHEIIFDFINVK